MIKNNLIDCHFLMTMVTMLYDGSKITIFVHCSRFIRTFVYLFDDTLHYTILLTDAICLKKIRSLP